LQRVQEKQRLSDNSLNLQPSKLKPSGVGVSKHDQYQLSVIRDNSVYSGRQVVALTSKFEPKPEPPKEKKLEVTQNSFNYDAATFYNPGMAFPTYNQMDMQAFHQQPQNTSPYRQTQDFNLEHPNNQSTPTSVSRPKQDSQFQMQGFFQTVQNQPTWEHEWYKPP